MRLRDLPGDGLAAAARAAAARRARSPSSSAPPSASRRRSSSWWPLRERASSCPPSAGERYPRYAATARRTPRRRRARRRGRRSRSSIALTCVGALDLRDVAAVLEDDLLGPRQPLLDVALERLRDERVVRAPDEQRRGAELAQARVEAAAAERLVEVDVARARQEREARAGRAVDALELVDGDVGDARVDRVGVAEQRPELALDHPAREAVRQDAELGAQQPDDRVVLALDERDGRTQQREAGDPLGVAQADLDRRRGRPSSCRRGARARCRARP